MRRDRTNLPPARYLAPLEKTEPSVLPPLGLKHVPTPRKSMNTADRAVHRATQKGYTAGRMPAYEPKIKTPATVAAWCDSVRSTNQLMTAGSCSGWLGGNRWGMISRPTLGPVQPVRNERRLPRVVRTRFFSFSFLSFPRNTRILLWKRPVRTPPNCIHRREDLSHKIIEYRYNIRVTNGIPYGSKNEQLSWLTCFWTKKWKNQKKKKTTRETIGVRRGRRPIQTTSDAVLPPLPRRIALVPWRQVVA